MKSLLLKIIRFALIGKKNGFWFVKLLDLFCGMWRKKWFLEIQIQICVVMIKKKMILMTEKSDMFLLLKKNEKYFF